MFTQRDVEDFNRYLENNPEEKNIKMQHNKDYEELSKTLERLKAKGIITNEEKGSSQNMFHRHKPY